MYNIDLLTGAISAYVGAVLLVYAGVKSYFRRRRAKASSTFAPLESLTPMEEQAKPTSETSATSKPTPSLPAPEPARPRTTAMYEMIQPDQIPITYAPAATTPFKAASLKKPMRGYRRRTAPIRSSSTFKAPRTTKPKKVE